MEASQVVATLRGNLTGLQEGEHGHPGGLQDALGNLPAGQHALQWAPWEVAPWEVQHNGVVQSCSNCAKDCCRRLSHLSN
eukprot:6400672-Alexandrium_andersonii.AAC.1